jgi:dTDP-4-dehydrorhamnose reductase
MAGSMLYTYLIKNTKLDIIGISKDKLDITSDNWKLNIKNIVSFNKDDIIVNCIGIIPQKVKNIKDNINIYNNVNTIFPHDLANFCIAEELYLIHLSTNCVFEKGPSSETKIPDATDIYGISKFKGEPIGKAFIIRTSIIGPEINKNKSSLFEWILKQDAHINGYINHIWNGITTLELSKIIELLIHTNLYKNYKIQHLYSINNISKYNLAKLIMNIFSKKQIDIKEYYTNDINTTLTSIYNITINKTIEEQLSDLYKFINIYYSTNL